MLPRSSLALHVFAAVALTSCRGSEGNKALAAFADSLAVGSPDARCVGGPLEKCFRPTAAGLVTVHRDVDRTIRHVQRNWTAHADSAAWTVRHAHDQAALRRRFGSPTAECRRAMPRGGMMAISLWHTPAFQVALVSFHHGSSYGVSIQAAPDVLLRCN
jgi:hypothetical protein